MSAQTTALALRPVEATDPADAAFLRALFVAGRPELAALAETGGAGEQLIDLQLRAQHADYLHRHPQAQDSLVVVDGQRVGRCWTAESPAALHLLDVGVHPVFRRRGIARAVLADVCRRADEIEVPVRLHVWHDNEPARRLYAAAGFEVIAEIGGYLTMRRGARASGSVS